MGREERTNGSGTRNTRWISRAPASERPGGRDRRDPRQGPRDDAYVRVSLIGIEILTIDARIVIASVDTYLRFAEAVGRLDIAHEDQSQGLPELMESMSSGGAKSKTKGVLEGAKESLLGSDEDEDKEQPRARRRRSSSRSRKSDS
jgi:gas vesicle structural protein